MTQEAAAATPGPWRWNKHDDDRHAGRDNPGYLYAPDVPYSVANETHPGEYLGVSVLHAIYPSPGDKYVRVTCKPADARVIESAPDAIDLLRRLVPVLDQVDPAMGSLMGELGKGPAADWYLVNKALCDAGDARKEIAALLSSLDGTTGPTTETED